MTSELRPVPDYPGLLASDDGHIFKQQGDGSLHLLKERSRTDGYVVVDAKKDGKWAPRTVHRLVAAAFYRQPEGPWEVTRHLDNDRGNNCASNLRSARRPTTSPTPSRPVACGRARRTRTRG
ncbi:HNH endonuclease [bacterium]|nr:HNH endonuclease [bacterium]